VQSVLPGLFPYMVLAQLLLSRLRPPAPLWLLTLLGWCGGSPTGARLAFSAPGLSGAQRRRLAVRCATMSPVFLVGTVGGWLDSGLAGACVLLAVLAGGALTGALVHGEHTSPAQGDAAPPAPITLGQSIGQSAQAMLTVCGSMVLMRVFAAALGGACPPLALPLTTLMEVTTGIGHICALPLPLALRGALAAGAAGFGGAALLLQNRACAPGLTSPAAQGLYQALHGGFSFLIGLGLLLLF